jgi:hypothetical protein
LCLHINRLIALLVFYYASWPASHILAQKPLIIEIVGGIVQWFVIGICADFSRKFMKK